MKDIKKIERKIEILREELQRTITQTTNLVDREVVAVSQKLDEVLNEYNNLIINQ